MGARRLGLLLRKGGGIILAVGNMVGGRGVAPFLVAPGVRRALDLVRVAALYL